jgi:hypothetical protein
LLALEKKICLAGQLKIAEITIFARNTRLRRARFSQNQTRFEMRNIDVGDLFCLGQVFYLKTKKIIFFTNLPKIYLSLIIFFPKMATPIKKQVSNFNISQVKPGWTLGKA